MCGKVHGSVSGHNGCSEQGVAGAVRVQGWWPGRGGPPRKRRNAHGDNPTSLGVDAETENQKNVA